MSHRNDRTLTPIGSTVDWFGSITGCPTLPAGWQLCDGAQILDQRSPMYLQFTPPLNTGSNRFIRGNITSGGTGGADTVTLAEAEIPILAHTYPVLALGAKYSLMPGFEWDFVTQPAHGLGGAHENKPGYTDAIKIIRIF